MKKFSYILFAFTFFVSINTPLQTCYSKNDHTTKQINHNHIKSDSIIIDSDSTDTEESSFDENEIDTTTYEDQLEESLHEWYASQMNFDNCHLTSNGIVLFPDSIYIKRLQKLPDIVEMPFNNIIRSYIDMYARRQKQISLMLGLGKTYYFPIFEKALSKYNVPLELKYLPIIESALNAGAVSRAGAGGLWQFMIYTGKLYGLEVNSLVDERCDPIKSSDAAARYLRDLYNIYGDWSLVIAAYNCGPGTVAKAIHRSGGKRSYWDIYPYLPVETRGYVPTFIAANYIMNYYKDHNICPAEPKVTTTTDTLMISCRIHLAQIAGVLNIPIEELQFLNPEYRHNIIPGNIKPYPLVLPLNKITDYLDEKDSILNYKNELVSRISVVTPAQPRIIYYKVKRGNTLGGIAKKYHVSVRQLKRWNNLRGSNIRVGKTLKIYR